MPSLSSIAAFRARTSSALGRSGAYAMLKWFARCRAVNGRVQTGLVPAENLKDFNRGHDELISARLAMHLVAKDEA